jgi:hypothetical protein
MKGFRGSISPGGAIIASPVFAPGVAGRALME